MNRLTSFLAFLWTALCAWVLFQHTRLLAGWPLETGWMDIMIVCGTLFVYNITANTPGRQWGGALAGLLAAYAWLQLPLPQMLGSLGPAVLWAVYLGLPGRFGLRDDPWFKPVAVALAWALVTVLLPLPLAWWGKWSGVALERACFIFALALAYDLLDRSVDRAEGLITLAGKLGAQATLRVMDIALLGSALLAGLNAGLSIYPWTVWPAAALSLVVSGRVVRTLLGRFGPQQWLKLVIDALMLVQAAMTALAAMTPH